MLKGTFPVEKFKTLPTPFYYYDMKLLQDTLDVVKQESGKYGYHVHYAIKANANPRILSLIAQNGLGADCVSGGEVQAALHAGFPANKIVFAGVGKADWEINLGLDNDIFCFNVESLAELEVINELAAAKAGHPYAADGRNLSYRKPLFFQQKEGFLSQLVRQSGEQARFVRQVAHRHNTSALYTPQSQTEMEPITDQAAWKKYRQLRFEAEHLHGLLPTLYACESVSFLLFHLAAIATCLLAIPTHQIRFALGALSLLLLRLLLGTLLLRKLSLRLGQPISRRWIPWLEWTQSASDIRLLFTQSLPFQRKRQ